MSSIDFEHQYSEETLKKLQKMFGEASAKDEVSILFDKIGTIQQKEMSKIAKEEKQPVTVTLYNPGEIKTMSDGTKYQVDEHGSWRRIWP